MKNRRPWLFIGLLLFVVGCSPTENWRVITLYDHGVTAMIPCKPDEAQRQVPLLGVASTLEMRSCELAGTTYAVAWLAIQDPAQASAAVQAWLTASQVSARISNAQPAEPASLPHADQAWRWQGQGISQGEPLQVEYVYAHKGRWLVQLATFQRGQTKPRGIESFWGGLTLPKS
ncbi:MAG: hypothetical protein RL357_496 [Pseudomonadota bacterium]